MPASNNETITERRLRLYTAGAGMVSAVIGAVHLVAWWTGGMTYRGLQTITMKTNAALCLVLCGLGLALLTREKRDRRIQLLIVVLASTATVIGGLTVLEHVFAWDFGIDQLLAQEVRGAMAVTNPNRMGPPGAVSFTLGGTAIVLLAQGREKAWRVAQWLGIVLCLIPLMGLLGYIYGVRGLYGAAKWTGIAWPTTVALILLATGVICARPSVGWMARITSSDPGGTAIRRLLVATIIIPIVLGWLRLQGEWHGLYERYIGTSIMIVSWIMIFSFLTYKTGALITESSQKLRLSEEKFANAFAHNSAAIVLARLDDGKYLDVNDTWLAMVEYRKDEVLGRTPGELKIWTNPDRERTISVLRQQGALHNIEITLRRRSGKSIICLASADILTIAGEKVILWSIVDITDRKRAEDALIERERQLHLFIEHAPAALAMFDREMRYLSASRRWNTMYGLGERDLTGLSHYDVFPEVSDEWKEFHRLGLAGEVHSAEVDRFPRLDGTLQWIRWEIRPWHDRDGNVGGIVIFAEDITSIKLAEDSLLEAKERLEIRVKERTRELENANGELRRETEERVAAMEALRRNEQLLLQQSRLAAMGEMMGNIAHQWRQPLNNLGVILQDLPLTYELGELTEDYLGRSTNQAMQLIQHMSHTIDDFRNFLQPEKVAIDFDVNDAITATISLFEATLKASRIDLQFKEQEHVVISGHRNEFCQVIMNLVTNARDAFKEREIGSPKVVIDLRRESGKAVITVTDNAGGIPEAVMDKIFDPYFTTKGPDKGTGIGLFMSKTIMEKSMNGSLTVRNTGDGAEFRIEVPSDLTT